MSRNREKLKNLVHYICDNVENPTSLGSVKLNKMLFYSERYNYGATGTSITGETYIKKPRGPVSKLLPMILVELENEGKLTARQVVQFGFTKHEYISKIPADISAFSKMEIGIVDDVIKSISGLSASEISEYSHDRVWELAEDDSEIPYFTFYVSEPGEISESDWNWARQSLNGKTK